MLNILVLILLSFFWASTDEIVAIIDFEARGITKEECEILTHKLITKMIIENKYTIVERNQMNKILKEQKFQNSGCTDQLCAVEIGQLLNADYTIIGNISKLGSTFSVDARLVDVGTSEAVKSAEFTDDGEIDVLLINGMESIAKQLSGTLSASQQRKENKKKNKRPVSDPNRVYDIPVGDSAVILGKEDAPITIIEWTDFQ